MENGTNWAFPGFLNEEFLSFDFCDFTLNFHSKSSIQFKENGVEILSNRFKTQILTLVISI